MSFRSFLLIAFLFAFLPLLASGQQQEKDFLEYYYENPQPEFFVEHMKIWAEEGTLENDLARPALIAFISQVTRSNRDRIEDWFEKLSGLTPEQKQVWFTGLLYSRTTEADEILKKTFGKQYEDQKQEIQKILEMPLDKRMTMDMLWGFFYATGSEHAIRRIVLCFRFHEAPDDPKGVDVPEGFQPLYKELPNFAFGSLVGNAERHPKLVRILETMLEEDSSLARIEKEGVYDVLAEVRPDKYPPVDRSGKQI